MSHPGRNNIYEATIRRMVNEALEQREADFEAKNSQLPDEALLAYLRESAAALGHSPAYKEIVGWRLMEQRFDQWQTALEKAGLSQAPRLPVTSLPRYREEEQLQKELYRKKKAQKKLRAQQRAESHKQKKNESPV